MTQIFEKLKNQRNQAIKALREIMDPEILLNIYDLGLIYGIDVDLEGQVYILLTFTSPTCPAMDTILKQIRAKLQKLSFCKNLQIEVVWDPPWDQSMVSEEAKLRVGLI